MELLAKELQEALLPKSFKIESPKKYFNDKGVQKYEIDIVLEGDFGYGKIYWGIECRDRPASGLIDRKWIQTLIGERNDLKFGKMIAVSTTGFSENALECARENGIDTIVIAESDEINIADIFPQMAVNFEKCIAKLKNVGLHIPKSKEKEYEGILGRQIGKDEKIFQHSDSKELFSAGDIVQRHLLTVGRLGEDFKDGDYEILFPFNVICGEKEYAINGVRATLEFQKKNFEEELVFVTHFRPEDQQVVGLTSNFTTDVFGNNIHVIVSTRAAANENLSLRFAFFDDSGKQVPVPSGKWGMEVVLK